MGGRHRPGLTVALVGGIAIFVMLMAVVADFLQIASAFGIFATVVGALILLFGILFCGSFNARPSTHKKATQRVLVSLLVVTIGLPLLTFGTNEQYLDPVKLASIDGSIRCASGAAVTGVWVEDLDGAGAGGFAELSQGLGKEDSLHGIFFSHSVARPSIYQLRIGCGGSPQLWRLAAMSPGIIGTGFRFLCNDDGRSEMVQLGFCAIVGSRGA